MSSQTLVQNVAVGDKIIFSYGVIPRRPFTGAQFRFTVSASTTGAASLTIFSAHFNPEDTSGWINHTLALDQFAKQKLTFHFSAESLDDTGHVLNRNPSECAWGGVRVGTFARRKNEMNLILISLDTLRADHLGINGYDRDTSPNIDALARGGIHFKGAITTCPWTIPAHRSMLTGLLPSAQQSFFAAGTRPIETLAPAKRVLTETLYLNGYRTLAFTGGVLMAAEYDFFRGFEQYSEHGQPFDSDFNVASALQWLDDNSHDKFFLFLHTYEAHWPYVHEHYHDMKESATPIERTIAGYDSGIHHADECIGKLIEKLKELNLTDHTIVIFTSDHGEELMERTQFGHSTTLYDELLRVPLIFYCPAKFKPRVVDRYQAQPTCLVPTVLDLLGLHAAQGKNKSIKSILLGGAVPSESFAMSNRELEDIAFFPPRPFDDSQSLRYVGSSGSFKYIFMRSTDTARSTSQEYYDLDKDPHELHNLPKQSHAVLGQLEELSHDALSKSANTGGPRTAPIMIDPELREKMRALGY